MSEQRFICGMGFTNADVNFYNPIRIIHDNENDKDYYLFADICKIMNEQQDTIQSLKERLYDFEKRKIIEESEIDEDVIPKVKLLRAELFGEKYE